MTENPGLAEVKRVVDRLEDEVREIRGTLEGGPLRGEGLLGRLKRLEEERIGRIEKEQEDLKRIVKGFEDAEKARADAQKERQVKVDRRQNILTGLVLTIFTTVVGNLILLYLSGFIGTGP